ncbi:MAG: hypothetical protein E6K70_17400, partial [Planctomycetota bacterium]
GPFAGQIRSGAFDPNAPAGTQGTVYRTRSLVVVINLAGQVPAQIEVSHSDGTQGTYTPAVTGLGLADIKTSVFLPLAVNTVKTPDQNGQPQDELLYWTNKIFESDNSANNWDPSSGILPPGADNVTALGFAPNTSDQFYVGTQQGRVFITLNNGGDGFPLRNAGLPARRVNGFAVDPSNPSVAYALFDGFNVGGGHVFRTTDGGSPWTDISSNLPDVPAYAMAIDPRPLPGFTGERLYLGTGVGVFVSTDNGATWKQLGIHRNADGTTVQTLPNVPVLDLQFNANFEELVAATQGRGAFAISTQVIGPRVIASTPGTPVLPGINAITVTFNEPVDPRSFTAAQVSARGPNGPIQVLGVKDLDPVNHLTFQVSFATQATDGIYSLTIGPNVRDFLGNAMDQNNNGINGEMSDAFNMQFTINTTDNGRFITGAYHDLLNRSADTFGFLNFLSERTQDYHLGRSPRRRDFQHQPAPAARSFLPVLREPAEPRRQLGRNPALAQCHAPGCDRGGRARRHGRFRRVLPDRLRRHGSRLCE